LPARDDITKLLADLSTGKDGAEEALIPLIYDELRVLARHYMRSENPGHTLQTTALVHEAYIRLGGEKDADWKDRAHYLRTAARIMRRVLIDHARRKGADKKGGHWGRQPLDRIAHAMEGISTDLLSVNDALEELSGVDAQMAQVVELRFFGGLTIEETAKVMNISASTVKNDWAMAKAWLMQRLDR
jgi:RNA polymerase sigma factor (TIGR02999 family)